MLTNGVLPRCSPSRPSRSHSLRLLTLGGLGVPALALAMIGCSALPGLPGFRSASEAESWWYPLGAPGRKEGYEPEIIPITPDLLVERYRQRQEGGSQGPARGVGSENYTYHVGPRDVLTVIVWGHPELSNPLGTFQDIEKMGQLVRNDGTVFFPYVGRVDVAGDTVAEIREHLTRELQPYIENPQVSVRVAAYRSKKAYVTGAVRKPGVFPITDVPLTVMDAINKAGGFVTRGRARGVGTASGAARAHVIAGQRTAILTHNDRRIPIDIHSLYASGEGNRILRDGDVLYIPSNEDNKVFVVGEVNQQQSVFMNKGELTLAEAISRSSGLNLETSNAGGIYVIRGVVKEGAEAQADRLPKIKPNIYRLDADHADALVLADAFQLQPHDVVFVSSAGLVRWNRVIRQVLPTLQALFQIEVISRSR